ncbi:MAG: polyhydroxyalkanoic acid system family protein [Burkholderiaceae bacterium]|jgi:putative polyhydroxyalkanoate system protein
MSAIDLHRRHGVNLKQAKSAAKRLQSQIEKEFDLKGNWKGNTLHFSRSGLSGTLVVTDKDVDIHVELGLLLSALRGRIQSEIESKLDELFGAR